MSKSLIRAFYVIGLVLGLIGAPLIVFSFMGSTFSQQAITGPMTLISIGHLPLFILGIVIAVLASLLIASAWIAALINTAQAQRWGWFVGLLVFTGVTLLAYILVGPDFPHQQPQPHL